MLIGLVHKKSSTSSSIYNGIHYDIIKDPIVGYALFGHMYVGGVKKFSQNASSFAYVSNLISVPNNDIIVKSQWPDILRRHFNSKDASFPV